MVAKGFKVELSGGVRAIKAEACGLYFPGHQVHQIHARLAWEGERAKGRVVSVDDDGWINVALDDTVERFWNHDVERTREIFAASSGQVEVFKRTLLMAPHGSGAYYDICVADTKMGVTPCVPLAKTESERETEMGPTN